MCLYPMTDVSAIFIYFSNGYSNFLFLHFSLAVQRIRSLINIIVYRNENSI